MLKRNATRLSLPQSKEVRGYAVTRAPLGRFLEALALLGDMPGTLAEELIGSDDPRELLAALKGCDSKELWRIIGRALKTAPARVVGLIAALAQIDAERLMNDPNLGLDGLCELALAWAEVNDIEGFFERASGLRRLWRTLATMKNGCSD